MDKKKLRWCRMGLNDNSEYAERIATFTSPAMAQEWGKRIADAVNAHDDLVAALREARIIVGSSDSMCARIALPKIDAALAKAGAL